VVAADVNPSWVHDRLQPWQLAEVFLPSFLGELATKLGRRVNAIDALMVAPSRSGSADIPLTAVTESDHPRVRRAERYREVMRIWTTPGGLLIVGRGLAGRWEAAIEVTPESRGQGLGRALAAAARHLVPDGRSIWAQVTPGNATSMRAFLAAGYVPVGQEALLVGPLSRPAT
jgi:GNAT superfamily N-acetyltransferase